MQAGVYPIRRCRKPGTGDRDNTGMLRDIESCLI